jgi:hypothetical protein
MNPDVHAVWRAQSKRGCFKRTPSFLYVHLPSASSLWSVLFVRPKRNEPKKKGAGNDNFSLFWQNALGVTLPKKAEVRAISGLPAHSLKI